MAFFRPRLTAATPPTTGNSNPNPNQRPAWLACREVVELGKSILVAVRAHSPARADRSARARKRKKEKSAEKKNARHQWRHQCHSTPCLSRKGTPSHPRKFPALRKTTLDKGTDQTRQIVAHDRSSRTREASTRNAYLHFRGSTNFGSS